jgi:hypothetical protein
MGLNLSVCDPPSPRRSIICTNDARRGEMHDTRDAMERKWRKKLAPVAMVQ